VASLSRHSKTILVVLVLTSAILGLLRFESFQVGAFSDDAHYIVLAESLASGRGYRLVSFPDAPVEWAFPPGWPALLSPFVALFPGNYEVLKLLSFALWLACIPLMYSLFAKWIESPYLDMLIGLIALNPSLVGMSGMVMSEAAYLFFSLVTLNLFEMLDNHAGKKDRRDKEIEWLLLLGISVAALYTQLIRTVGLSLMITIPMYLILTRRFRQAGVVIMFFLLGILPQLWLNTQSGGSLVSSGYESQVFGTSIGMKLGQLWANLQSYCDEKVASSLVPIFGPNVASALDSLGVGLTLQLANALILLLIAFGAALSLRFFQISDLYVAFYCVSILAFWNPRVGSAQARFLIPIIPFLYFYLFRALIWFVSRTAARNRRRSLWAVTGLVCLLGLTSLARNVQDWRNPLRNRITDLSIGTSWIHDNASATSIVMARDPVPAYLYARRKTVAYPDSAQGIHEYIRTFGVDYILVSPELQIPRSNELGEFVQACLLPLLESDKDSFKLVYTNAAHNVAVYKYCGSP